MRFFNGKYMEMIMDLSKKEGENNIFNKKDEIQEKEDYLPSFVGM